MRIFSLILLLLVTFTFAAKAPTHRSLRTEAMGNAHVAIVDGVEAIYFNYAGLNQINRLGNYDMRPEQGYYPRNRGDMRLNVGASGPFETYFDTYDLANDLQKLYNRVKKSAKNNGLSESNVLMDTLAAHPELLNKLNNYDHKYLNMNLKFDAELAFHNFGGAFWVDATISPYIDAGLIIPFMQIDTFYVDGVVQIGGAYGITDNLSVGAGFKIAKRHKVDFVTIDVLKDFDNLQDTLEDRIDDVSDKFFDMKTISMGIDLGVLYQLAREVKVGMSLRDIYFKSLAGDKFTPNFTAGINYSPRFFNKNTGYGRKLNIACDYADAFNGQRNYKPFSHINFGMEFEQTLLAWPGYNNAMRMLSLRLSGGFKGGYPAAGFGVEVLRFITVEFATWAEELGYYTGQDEERIYMGQISIGF